MSDDVNSLFGFVIKKYLERKSSCQVEYHNKNKKNDK